MVTRNVSEGTAVAAFDLWMKSGSFFDPPCRGSLADASGYDES
jgi:hypothetical protein